MQTLDGYQLKALSTAEYPKTGDSILFPLVALCGDVGKLIEAFFGALPDGGEKECIPVEVVTSLNEIWRAGLALARVQALCADSRHISLTNGCLSDRVDVADKMGEALKGKVGAVIWDCAALAFELKLSLEGVAAANHAEREAERQNKT